MPWDSLSSLSPLHLVFFCVALLIAFAFEFINGFHDTANAVTTVIYTRTLRPTPAVVYSGIVNFFGVLFGGTAVAFSIVNLLPVDLLIEATSSAALVMVLSLLLAGVIWNLLTWYHGLPVSSSHTLIGSILGAGMANSLLTGRGLGGVNWSKAGEVGLALLISPVLGFVASGLLLLAMRWFIREPRLYVPPVGDDRPPWWIRGVLLVTCGGVSYAHGSNDGQKGMGLILLVLIGFLPFQYALNVGRAGLAQQVHTSMLAIGAILEERNELTPELKQNIDTIDRHLAGKTTLSEVAPEQRWEVRQAILSFRRHLAEAPLPDETRTAIRPHVAPTQQAIEFVPLWVVIGVALALGIGTMIGYQRIVVTVAEKIGKTHLTYGQGAAAELVAALTILGADIFHMPVSTTHVLSSGIAGTMAANRSGIQIATIRKIGLAWILTLPCAMLLSGLLFTLGRLVVR